MGGVALGTSCSGRGMVRVEPLRARVRTVARHRTLRVGAEFREYTAARRMKLRVRTENPHAALEGYLQNAERVVNVTFPDENRRELITPGSWRVRLLPIQDFGLLVLQTVMTWGASVSGHAEGVGPQFLWVNFQAENMIRAWATPNGMNLVVSELFLRGLPLELADLNNKLKFELKGQLTVEREGLTTLDGLVVMKLGADLPPVFAAAPGVDALSKRIMNTILEKLEVSLVQGLRTDYFAWVDEQQNSNGAGVGEVLM